MFPQWHSLQHRLQEAMLPAGALGSSFRTPVLKCVEECGKELRGGHGNAIPGAKVLPICFRLLHCRGQLGWLPGKQTEQDVVLSQKSHGAPICASS